MSCIAIFEVFSLRANMAESAHLFSIRLKRQAIDCAIFGFAAAHQLRSHF